MKSRSILLAALVALPSLACAPVPGEGRFVHIATEEAIIIWDEGAKRQHFIRRASFDTDARHFGLLVPTPGRPELGESDDRAFERIEVLTANRVVPPEDAARLVAVAKPAAVPRAVTVLEQKTVAGYDAAVLETTDAQALDGWLRDHRYPSSPELVEWLAPYVAAKWKITAFKIAGNSPKVSSAAVRMSFQTERPFFPYREPATQRAAGAHGPRLLRVYFVADGRFGGAIGESARWPGRPVWSKEIGKQALAELLNVARLPPLAGGGGRWVTVFEDYSSPRPGTEDVYFSRAAVQTVLEGPPAARDAASRGISININWMYVAWSLLALVVGAVAYSLWRLFRGFF